MSVTFSLKDTPYDKVITEYGEDYVPKDGWLELNLCNTNAADLLVLLNRSKDARNLYGEWRITELHDILQLLRKLNSIEFEKETLVDGNLVVCGRDPEYASTRVGQMRKLVELAISKDTSIVFS